MTWAHILFAAVAALLAFLAWLLLFHPLHDHPYREETDELTAQIAEIAAEMEDR